MTWPLLCAEGSLRASCRPTPPIRPSTTLSNPQGASLCDPAASSNSSYVPCYQLLCESRLSTPARHIRSYPFWVKSPCQSCKIGSADFPPDHVRCLPGDTPCSTACKVGCTQQGRGKALS